MNNYIKDLPNRKNKVSELLKQNLMTCFFATSLVFVTGISHAEDVEIFTGVIDGADNAVTQNPDFFPNLLFILDNSTSMGETEPILDRIASTVGPECGIDVSDYDPDKDYSFGQATNDSDIYIYSGIEYTGKTVSEKQNQCKAYIDDVVNGASNPPLITTKIIQWGLNGTSNKKYKWDGDVANLDGSDDSAVECQSDEGTHGHFTRNTGDTNPRNRKNTEKNSDVGESYFSNSNAGTNPYNDAESVDWVSGNYHRYLQLKTNGSGNLPDECKTSGTDTYDPFNSLDISGTINNPELATDIDDICGGGSADRSATTGRSQLNIGGTTQYYKNRYYKIKDATNDTLFNVYRCQTRLDVMKTALTNVLENETSINAGLMRFNTNANGFPGGGTVISAISPMNDVDNKKLIQDEINALEFGQATPLAESLYEAYRYYAGLTIDQGRKSPGSSSNQHATFDVDFLNLELRDRSDFETDSRAKSGSSYKSPIKSQCQDNNIILLSDGEPSGDTGRNTTIGNLIGGTCSGSTCSDDIAGHMKTTDIASASNITKGVNTFTIGLNLDSQTLKDISNAGGPDGQVSNFSATNTAGLENAFRSILGQIQDTEADVFSAPAVTVNAFNRLQNREDLYFALFRPENTARWAGNVKKYRVQNDIDNPIIDANGNDAIDDDISEGDAEGFFFDTTQSFWSSEADGGVVDKGGAGEQLTYARRMFGHIGNNDVPISSPDVNNAVTEFLNQTNGLDIGQLSVQGDTAEENRKKIAQWTLGLDVNLELESNSTNNSNQYVGDSLHGTPYVLSFGDDENNPLDVIFYTSNQGILHAIDGDSGEELWSYIPDESLFGNLGAYYNNNNPDKLYGLDGELAFKITRDPSTAKEIDSAVLFFGQRRGGNKVFSVDVTEARKTGTNSPVDHRWVIEGGAGGTAGYERLGQTWAEPIVSNVNYCDTNSSCADGNSRSVVFISGGYDEFYDDASAKLSDAQAKNVVGNAVYMVDSETGELLWMVGGDAVNNNRDLELPEMVHSVVSPPTVIDSDSNGTADTLFFTDISGQVFRVDFRTALFDSDDVSSGDNFQSKQTGGELFDNVSGGLIASFQEANVNRRFYNPLSLTILPASIDDIGNILAPVRYAITTGTGYRAHPLAEETFDNRVYVIYDKNILTPQSDEEFRENRDTNDIADADYFYGGVNLSPPSVNPERIIEANSLTSINVNGGATDSDAITLSSNPPLYSGYYINLPENSEKFLNPGLITDFQLLAVTYIPSDNNASNLSSTCEAGLGTSRLYSFNLLTGESRLIVLKSPGISPAPVIVYLIDDEGKSVVPIVIVGTEPILKESEDNPDKGLPLNSLDIGKANKQSWWETGRVR